MFTIPTKKYKTLKNKSNKEKPLGDIKDHIHEDV